MGAQNFNFAPKISQMGNLEENFLDGLKFRRGNPAHSHETTVNRL